MKKGFIRLLAAASVTGFAFTGLSAGMMPVAAFAEETVAESFKIFAETIDINTGEIVSPDDYGKFGQVIVDKTEAKAGETVTVKAVDGSESGFGSRFSIRRTTDGKVVTEELLGERKQHSLSGESFTMPAYDIVVSSATSPGWVGSPPVPSIIVDGYDDENALIHPVQTEQTEGGMIRFENADELIAVDESFPQGTYGVNVNDESARIIVSAVPDPGHRFVKWYAKSFEFGVGITEDILEDTSTKNDENGISVTTSTFKMPYAGFLLKAVFEETDPHNISIEKRFDDIEAEIDKTTARVGEKVHLKVDTGNSTSEPDLNCIIIKRADNGEEIQRIDGFLGHDHFWEGDISMPDTDIVIEIASWKWAPKWMRAQVAYFNIKFKDLEGNDLTKDVSYDVSSKIHDEDWQDAGEIVSFDKNESRIDHRYEESGGRGLTHDMINSYIKINSVPDGYKLPDAFVLSSAAKDGTLGELDVSVSDRSVSVIKADADGWEYDIVVTLEKATTVAGDKKSSGNVSSVAASQTKAGTPVRVTTSVANVPATGDRNNTQIWMAAGIAAAAAGALTAVKLKRTGKKEDQTD